MPEITLEDVEWAGGDSPLDDIFCLTFVKGSDETGALLGMGGLPDTLRPRTLEELGEAKFSFEDGYPDMAWAVSLGAWTVVIEPQGFNGAHAPLLAAMSRGTEAVAVLRHDYASDWFGYAVDGTLMTAFEPMFSQARHGAEPDRLLDLMRAAGLPVDEDDPLDEVPAVTRALLLAGLITGVVPSVESTDEALPSAEIQSWFADAVPFPKSLRDAELAAVLDMATPDLLHQVAISETHRLAAVIGISETPGLAQALSAAGPGTVVSSDSDLGRAVRSWLATSNRASWSTNTGEAHKMTEEERHQAFLLGWFVEALGVVLRGDPGTAARGALRPLASGPPPLADPARRTTVLNVLSGQHPPSTL